MLTPRMGPAYVDVPMDVLLSRMSAEAAPAIREPLDVSRRLPDPDVVARVADLLAQAQQPVIVAGSGAYWARAEAALTEFASIAGAPIFLNGMARGLLGRDHPFQVTKGRQQALRAADLVVLLGADFDFRLGFGQDGVVHRDATIVQVDPDGAQLGRNRHVQVPVVADVGLFMADLVELAAKYATTVPRRWTRNLQERSVAGRLRTWREAGDSSPVDPDHFVAELCSYFDADATVIGDGGDIVANFAQHHRPGGPGLWMDPGPFGCLGIGAPFAIGARLHRPQTQVAVVFGDGSFGFNGFELDSAVRQDLPFVGVVGNDGAWGEMRTFHEDVFGGADLRAQHLSQDTSYAGVATALGGHGERVDRASEIEPALQRAFDAGVPAIVDVLLDPTHRHQNGAVSGRHVARAYGKGDPDAFKRRADDR
jgi:acetolactate synthase-1/2/3 large subunit